MREDIDPPEAYDDRVAGDRWEDPSRGWAWVRRSYAVGLMSGTSADGIDAALVEIEEVAGSEFPRARLIHFLCIPFSEDQRRRIFSLFLPDAPIAALGRLDVELGEEFGNAVNRLLSESGIALSAVRAIGCHGQTVAHYPPEERSQHRGFTLQIGNAAVIAAMTRLPVVSRFRDADMAAGGQGAPLVPYFDYATMRSDDEDRVLLNIGGVANITVLPRGAALEDVIGFDTGPGNMVLDGLVDRLSGGRQHFDSDGRLAAQGIPRADLIAGWLGHPYFRLRPPKSTGREAFGTGYVGDLFRTMAERELSGPDMLRTATAFVARTIVDAIRSVTEGPLALIATGGGALNPVLMQTVAEGLDLLRPWETGDRYGILGDAKEAMAFAYLAWQFLAGRPTNVPSVTGASRRVRQGAFTPPAEAADPRWTPA